MLAAMLALVRGWGDDGVLGAADTEEVISYLKEALGVTGSGWEGAMGDYTGRDVPGHQSTNNAAESHFRIIDRCILQDVAGTSLVDLVELLLGVTAEGKASQRMSYFQFFQMQKQEREQKGGGVIAGDILRRSVEGRYVHVFHHCRFVAPASHSQI